MQAVTDSTLRNLKPAERKKCSSDAHTLKTSDWHRHSHTTRASTGTHDIQTGTDTRNKQTFVYNNRTKKQLFSKHALTSNVGTLVRKQLTRAHSKTN
jgi:hypothetical protein